MSMYWQTTSNENLVEIKKLQKQADNSEKILNELNELLAILRQEKKELSAKLVSQKALYDDQIQKLKSELKQIKSTLNRRRPNMNGVFKQKRMLEATNRTLESEKQKLHKTLYGILDGIPCVFRFEQVCGEENDIIDMYSGTYCLGGFCNFENGRIKL